MEKKYEKSPTKKEVDYIARISGMTKKAFARFYGINEETFADFRKGKRPLPEKHWHLFFDPPKPIQEKLDRIGVMRARAKSYIQRRKIVHVSKFAKKEEEKKEQRIEVKKIGVLKDLLG